MSARPDEDWSRPPRGRRPPKVGLVYVMLFVRTSLKGRRRQVTRRRLVVGVEEVWPGELVEVRHRPVGGGWPELSSFLRADGRARATGLVEWAVVEAKGERGR